MPYFHHHEHRLFYREQGSGDLLLILPGNSASSAFHEAELVLVDHIGARNAIFVGAADTFLLQVTEK